MNIKNNLLLLLYLIFLSACDMGPNMDFEMTPVTTKIFQYNISDSSTKFIAEGYSPIFLQKTNKLIYKNNGLKLFDLITNDTLTLASNFEANLSISPDEKYIAYYIGNRLQTINITNGEKQTLFESEGELNSYLPPSYSSDGKEIIFITRKTDTDSFYVNLYNLEIGNYIRCSKLISRPTNKNYASFSNNSEMFYVFSREREGGNYEIRLSVFNNTDPPSFNYNKILYVFGYDYKNSVVLWNIEEMKILILANRRIYKYDLYSRTSTLPNDFNSYQKYIKRIKYSDNLIGLSDDNKIGVSEFNGEIKAIYDLKERGEINWIDFSIEQNSIFYQTIIYGD